MVASAAWAPGSAAVFYGLCGLGVCSQGVRRQGLFAGSTMLLLRFCTYCRQRIVRAASATEHARRQEKRLAAIKTLASRQKRA